MLPRALLVVECVLIGRDHDRNTFSNLASKSCSQYVLHTVIAKTYVIDLNARLLPSEILVLGTGATLVRPSPELQKFLLVRGISTEVSSTVCPIKLVYSYEVLF